MRDSTHAAACAERASAVHVVPPARADASANVHVGYSRPVAGSTQCHAAREELSARKGTQV